MPTSVLYGVKADDLDSGCHVIEQLLNIKMDPHDSFFMGGNYFNYDDPRNGRIFLRENIDIEELNLGGKLWDDFEYEELFLRGAILAEPEFPQYRFLLYVESADKMSDYWTALDAATDVVEKLTTNTWISRNQHKDG